MTSEEKAVMRKELEEKWGYSLKEVAELLRELIDEQEGATHHKKAVYDKQIEMRVTDILRKIGIPANVRGYRYVRTAIIMVYNDSRILEAITKELYPEVARRYKTTCAKVERAIRHAIYIAYTRGNMDAMDKYFEYDGLKPTNSQFIATIVDFLDMNED